VGLSHEAVSPLGFSLTFAAGKGIAALRNRRLGAIEVERLDLEIPKLVFPFDISGGVSRFQNRRCVVRSASFSISEESLAALLVQAHPGGALRLHVREGYLSVAGRFAWREGESLDLSARLYLDLDASRSALLLVEDLRLYGVAPAPAPLVARALLSAIRFPKIAREEPRFLGTSAVAFDPLRVLVSAYLPPLGWKIPELREVRLDAVQVSGGRVSFRYGAREGGERPQEPSREILRAREALRLFRGAEESLLVGDTEDALGRFQREALRVGEHPLIDLRVAELLAAAPGKSNQARSHIETALSRAPERAHAARLHALAAQALLRAGDADEALPHLESLAAFSEEGDPEEALFAGLWLAHTVPARGAHAAIPRLERLAQRHPGYRPVSAALAELYAYAGRSEDLALLLRELAASEEDPQRAALLRVQLGDLYRGPLADPARARAQYERALARDPRCVEAWCGVAEVFATQGETRAALRALDEALACAPGDDVRASIHVRAGGVWETALQDPDGAALRYGEALALRPGNTEALWRLAALHSGRGRHVRAAVFYEELGRHKGLDPASRARALMALAALYRGPLDDREESYACARRALELDAENPEAREMLEELRPRPFPPFQPPPSAPTARDRLARQGDDLSGRQTPGALPSPAPTGSAFLRGATELPTPPIPRQAPPRPAGELPAELRPTLDMPALRPSQLPKDKAPSRSQVPSVEAPVVAAAREKAPSAPVALAVEASTTPAPVKEALPSPESYARHREPTWPAFPGLARERGPGFDDNLEAFSDDIEPDPDILWTGPTPSLAGVPHLPVTPAPAEPKPVPASAPRTDDQEDHILRAFAALALGEDEAPTRPVSREPQPAEKPQPADPGAEAPVITAGLLPTIPPQAPEEAPNTAPAEEGHAGPARLSDRAQLRAARRAAEEADEIAAARFLAALLSFLDDSAGEAFAPSAYEPHPGALLAPSALFQALAPKLGPLAGSPPRESAPGPEWLAEELFSLAARGDAPPFALRWGEGSRAEIFLHELPQFVLGADLAHAPQPERRAVLSAALADLALSAPLARALSPSELEEVVFLMAAACDPVTAVADEGNLSPGMRAQAEALLADLGESRREELAPAVSALLDAYGNIDFAAFRKGILASRDRLSLVIAGDLRAVLALLHKASPEEPRAAFLLRDNTAWELLAFAARACGAKLLRE
jgi:tetratricopeptide (TPR) repeat protein